LSALSGIYGGVARLRRAWYQPHRQRHLVRPVVSVGNLAMGGSGKTPVVAALVRTLQAAGERPAVLSRGYGRRSQTPVVVVSDGSGPQVDVDESGDEPQMLARALRGAPVVVARDRFVAGRLAEGQLAATVHVLDDGFQHLRLARDIDLLLVSMSDLSDRVLPSGRLREPLSMAARADAVLVVAGAEEADKVARLSGAQRVFRVNPQPRRLLHVHPFGHPVAEEAGSVVAVSGIARPERFHASLQTDGMIVGETVVFRDHHWYTAPDIDRVEAEARRVGASRIVTTAKDAVRLEALLAARPPEAVAEWVYLSYDVDIDPADEFAAWLRERLVAARAGLQTGPA